MMETANWKNEATLGTHDEKYDGNIVITDGPQRGDAITFPGGWTGRGHEDRC